MDWGRSYWSQAYWDVRLLLVEPSTLIALAVVAVLTFPIARLIARRTRRPWWLTGLAVGAVGVILAATLGPDMLNDPIMSLRGCVESLLDFRGDLRAISEGLVADALPNVILYLPAGFLVAVLTRRPVLTLLSLIALSAGVEIVQPYLARSCTSTDWMSNSAGALVGVAGAVVLTLLIRRHPRGRFA